MTRNFQIEQFFAIPVVRERVGFFYDYWVNLCQDTLRSEGSNPQSVLELMQERIDFLWAVYFMPQQEVTRYKTHMTNLYAEYTKDAFAIMKSQGGEAGAFYDAFKKTFTVNNNQLEVDITREKFASLVAEYNDGRVFFYTHGIEQWGVVRRCCNRGGRQTREHHDHPHVRPALCRGAH